MQGKIELGEDKCCLRLPDILLKTHCFSYSNFAFFTSKNFSDRCIDVISFSELKDHLDCSYRHKLKYVDGINMFEENVHTNFGTALHDTCEHYIKTREMRYEIALDYILWAWQKYELPDMGAWMKQAVAILKEVPIFLDERFPGWKCFNAEEKLEEQIEGRFYLDKKFKGYIDAIIEHEGKYYIIDWKSSTKGWNDYKKNDEKLRLQLMLYAKFWGEKHGIDLSNINVGFAILNRDLTNPERIEFFMFPVEHKDTKKSLKIINNSLSMMDRNLYFKRWKYQEPRFQGDCRFCDFNGTKYCP